jgi:hypothetical protein
VFYFSYSTITSKITKGEMLINNFEFHTLCNDDGLDDEIDPFILYWLQS